LKTEALPIVLTLEEITIANPYILDEQYTGAVPLRDFCLYCAACCLALQAWNENVTLFFLFID